MSRKFNHPSYLSDVFNFNALRDLVNEGYNYAVLMDGEKTYMNWREWAAVFDPEGQNSAVKNVGRKDSGSGLRTTANCRFGVMLFKTPLLARKALNANSLFADESVGILELHKRGNQHGNGVGLSRLKIRREQTDEKRLRLLKS